MSDEQRERILIAEQIGRAAAANNETEDMQEPVAEEGLKRTDENQKVVLSLSLKPPVATTTTSSDTSAASSSSQMAPAPASAGIGLLKMNPLKAAANPLKRTNVFKTASMGSSLGSNTAPAPTSVDDKVKKRPMSAVESIIFEEQERKRRKMEREGA